jgi:polyhydroxyalkanoate synthesis repressor PhaR
MPVIKRYPNRKLYDMEAKQYITLEGIADRIRKGEEIHVIDNATGEDLTALTLTQIILEQEKKQSGFLPRSVLASLIQAGGDRFTAFQRSLVSTLGFWQQIDEEIKHRIQTLISQGELSEGEGHSLIEKLLSPRLRDNDETRTQQEEPQIRLKDLEEFLAERQIPTREDLKQLTDQLEILAARFEELEPPPSSPQVD